MCCIQYVLYILVYFDGGHPKFFCQTPPPPSATVKNKKAKDGRLDGAPYP